MAHDKFTPLTPEQAKERRRRAIITALALGAAVALVFVITIVRLGPAIFDRPL